MGLHETLTKAKMPEIEIQIRTKNISFEGLPINFDMRCDLILNDIIIIKDVWLGTKKDKSKFIKFPSKKNKDGTYDDYFACTSRKVYDKVLKSVTSAYIKAKEDITYETQQIILVDKEKERKRQLYETEQVKKQWTKTVKPIRDSISGNRSR